MSEYDKIIEGAAGAFRLLAWIAVVSIVLVVVLAAAVIFLLVRS